MQFDWVVDENMSNPLYGGGFVETLKEMGREVVTVTREQTFRAKPLLLNSERRYVAYTGIQANRFLCSEFNNVQSFSPSTAYNFTYLSSRLDRKALLSSDYFIETYGQLIREGRLSEIRDAHDGGSEFFVRPDSGMKTFAGELVSLGSPRDMRDIGASCHLSMECPIIVATRKDILAEYRFFMSRQNGIISCSRYNGMFRDMERERMPVPDAVKDHAMGINHTLGEDAPDALYVLDIAETTEGLFAVELNAASTSGLYACQARPIIEEMERILREEGAWG